MTFTLIEWKICITFNSKHVRKQTQQRENRKKCDSENRRFANDEKKEWKREKEKD